MVGSREAIAFPYHLVSVTSVDETLPKELLDLLQTKKCFISAPDFDEYVTAVAMTHSPSGPRPPWMEVLFKNAQTDWMAALHSNNVEERPAWLKKGKGKEDADEDEHDFANLLKSSLSSSSIPLNDMESSSAEDSSSLLLVERSFTKKEIETSSAIKAGAKTDPKGTF